MGVTPVRAHISFEVEGIGGVANNPVVFWILRNHLADSISSKRLAFLVEDFNQNALHRTLHHCLLPDRLLQ